MGQQSIYRLVFVVSGFYQDLARIIHEIRLIFSQNALPAHTISSSATR